MKIHCSLLVVLALVLLPILESVVKTRRRMSVHIVVIVRHRDSVSWFVEAVERMLGEKMENCSINIEVYVTQSDRVVSEPSSGSSYSPADESITLNDLENTDVLAKMSSEIRSKGKGNGRPDIKTLIRETTDAVYGSSLGVVACGPAAMMLDVRNACAEAQARILKGGGGAREVWLHTEAFGW
jgi:hypothetical protein